MWVVCKPSCSIQSLKLFLICRKCRDKQAAPDHILQLHLPETWISQNYVLTGSQRKYTGLGCLLIGNDFHIEIQVVNTEACVCQEEGECDHYLLVIWAPQPWIKHVLIQTNMQLHHREGYLTNLTLRQTANVESFHSCQGLLFITFSSLIGTSVLYIARVVAGTCKQSQITWGCFPTFFVWHFLEWSDLHLPEVLFHAWLYCFTLCVKRLEQNMKDLWHFVVKQGVMKGEQEWAWGIRRSLCSTCAMLQRQSHVSACSNSLAVIHSTYRYKYTYCFLSHSYRKIRSVRAYLVCDQLKAVWVLVFWMFFFFSQVHLYFRMHLLNLVMLDLPLSQLKPSTT